MQHKLMFDTKNLVPLRFAGFLQLGLTLTLVYLSATQTNTGWSTKCHTIL